MLLTDSIIIKGGASSGKFLESNAAGLGAWGAVAQSGNNSQNLSDPLDISGCVLWLKADAGVFNDSGTTPASSGGTVQQWNDQSASGNNATQTNVSFQPTYLTNGFDSYPVLRFNGVTTFLNIANNSGLSPSTITLFGVVNHENNNASGRFFISKGPQGSGYGLGMSTATNARFEASGGNRRINAAASSLSTVTTARGQNIIVGVAARSVISLYTNGSGDRGIPTAYDGCAVTTGSLGIGAPPDGGGQNYSGNIAEIIIYNRALNTVDISRITDYLSTKYSIYS